MVSFRVWTFVFIFVILCVFVPIANGSNNKHRVVHRHGRHHHHHHNHRHHKHPKVRLSSVKKSSTEEYTGKINVTHATRLWRADKTFMLSNGNYSADGRVSTIGNFPTVKSVSNINSTENNTDLTKMAISLINSSTVNSLNIVEYWQTVQQTTVSEITEVKRDVVSTIASSSMSPRNMERSKSPTNGNSKSFGVLSNGGSIHFPNDLQRLFGSEKDDKNSTTVLIEPPFVQLVRKKRSTSRLDEATNGKSRALGTLLDIIGPAVANDSEEAIDRESLHRRVKRDGSESDDAPSALSSHDSNYLQDLEESFAPSALEIEALKSEASEKYQRKFQRSQFDTAKLSRSKRNVQHDDNEMYKTDNKFVVVNNIDGSAEDISDSSSLHPYTNTSDRNDEIVGQTVDNRTNSKTIETRSQNLDLENSIVPITGYRDDVNFDLSESEKITKPPDTEKRNDKLKVVSASTESSLKDDNSLLTQKLDDVDPEIVEDVAHPSPLVAQLVRAKRFSDGFVGLEASDASYANQLDNSRTVDEPYAEDNIIIDSMLEKVDYGSADERNRLTLNDNEAEIYSPRREIASIRNKRGTLSKRSRKKTNGRRRGSKKRKKKKKGRAKKPHRSKIKREFDNVAEETIYESQKNGEFDNENFGDRNIDNMEQPVISPHDGRRRRESESEQNDYFNSRQNEATDSDRKDVQRSALTGSQVDNNNQDTQSSASRNELNEESQTRAKRDNALQELKYFENVRETDGAQNRSEEVADKHVPRSEKSNGPIEEIEHLAEQLLAKVNALHGYINEGCVNDAMQDSRVSTTITDRTTADESNVVQRVTSPDDPSPKLVAADVEKRPESCWKHPATWTRQSESSKTNAKSARNLRAQKCSKKVRRKRTSHRKWDRWTDWSSCSVTCGRGRQIRWRHCIRNCSTAETEMEEKACQLPACAPGKFLGIFG